MHMVSPIYAMPTILNSLKPLASNAAMLAGRTTANAATAGSTSSSSTGANLGTTFLNLLSQELKNQDPTAPVDSTAMVGQMISLNQLDQLISINQILKPVPAPTKTEVARTTASGAAPMSANSGLAGMLSPSASGAVTNQLPFDPNTMMPLSSGNAGAVAASINSSLDAATLGFSGTNNNSSTSNSGGK